MKKNNLIISIAAGVVLILAVVWLGGGFSAGSSKPTVSPSPDVSPAADLEGASIDQLSKELDSASLDSLDSDIEAVRKDIDSL